MMWVMVGVVLMVGLRLATRGRRRRAEGAGQAQAIGVEVGQQLDPGGIGWARDPITGQRDRGGF